MVELAEHIPVSELDDVKVELDTEKTTGGYTRIGCVISADLPLAAQLRPGDRVRFSSCSLKEAHEALRSWSNAFDAWRGAAAPRVMRVKVNGKAYDITVEET